MCLDKMGFSNSKSLKSEFRQFTVEWAPEFRGMIDVCKFQDLGGLARVVGEEVIEVLYISPNPLEKCEVGNCRVTSHGTHVELLRDRGALIVVGWNRE